MDLSAILHGRMTAKMRKRNISQTIFFFFFFFLVEWSVSDERRTIRMEISPRAGQPAVSSDLVDVPKLLGAYYEDQPDPHVPEQRVVFGTSGHRGSSFERSFNEWHILAITQAICLYRRQRGIDGPLFLGIDTHALEACFGNCA